MKTIEKKSKKMTAISAKVKGRYPPYGAAVQAKLEQANKTLANTDLSVLFKNDLIQ